MNFSNPSPTKSHNKNTVTRIGHYFFTGDPARHEGVACFNIFLLRALYVLMAIFVSKDAWTYLLSYDGVWNPLEAVSWCVWAAFSVLAVMGIIHPVKMIPIILLEIFYKLLWLLLIARPLWSEGQLQGSSAEDITYAFLWVLLPIVAVPWGYVWKTFMRLPNSRTP